MQFRDWPCIVLSLAIAPLVASNVGWLNQLVMHRPPTRILQNDLFSERFGWSKVPPSQS